MKTRTASFLIFLTLLASGCATRNSWVKVPNVGPPISMKGDPHLDSDASRSDWRWVVVKNTTAFPLHVGFRPLRGLTEYKATVLIAPGERVALRVGPDDVEFLWVSTNPEHEEFSAPLLIEEPITEAELNRRHPGIRRL